jgi:hypothetical protein
MIQEVQKNIENINQGGKKEKYNLPQNTNDIKKLLDSPESREDIKNATKESFEKKIAEIRKDPSPSKENAFILQTYAVLFLGVTESEIGGIDGKF